MVYYHIPEDFDDSEQPNAFGIGKAIDEIKLSDIKRLFPIEGTYHFRFKHVSNKTTLWMDLNDDDSKAIAYQNRIVMKVTRVSWEATHSNHTPPEKPKPVAIPNPSKTSSFNLFEFEPAAPKKKVEEFDLLFPN